MVQYMADLLAVRVNAVKKPFYNVAVVHLDKGIKFTWKSGTESIRCDICLYGGKGNTSLSCDFCDEAYNFYLKGV